MATHRRHRFRTDMGTLHGKIHVYNPYAGSLAQQDVDLGVVPYFTKYEDMYDEYDAPKPFPAWNDHVCDHLRVSGEMQLEASYTHLVEGTLPGEPDITVYVTPLTLTYHSRPEDVLLRVPTVPADVLGELAYRALQKFTTDIEEETSLLNFLYELKDLDNLVQALLGSFSHFKLFIEKPGLLWTFGIKPLCEDILKFMGLFDKVQSRIKFLKEHNGKEVTVNYTREKVEEMLPFGVVQYRPLFIPYEELPEFPDTSFWVEDVSITFRAHARIRINCEYLDRWDKQMDAFAKAIGVGSFFQWMKAGWQAVPYTWLLGFFFRVNRLWDKLDVSIFSSLGGTPIEVVTSTHSLRVKTKMFGITALQNGGILEPSGSYSVTRFVRANGLPMDTADGILRVNGMSSSLSMLLILLQILLPGFKFGRRK